MARPGEITRELPGRILKGAHLAVGKTAFPSPIPNPKLISEWLTSFLNKLGTLFPCAKC